MWIGGMVIVLLVVTMLIVIVNMLMTMALIVFMSHMVMRGSRAAGTYSLDMMMVAALRCADLVLEAKNL